MCPRWQVMGLVNTFKGTIYVLSGMGWVWATKVEIHILSSLAWKRFGQTQVEIHFVFLLAWEGFGQHMLRCIFCPRLHERGLVNTSRDTFYVLARKIQVCSIQVETYSVSSLAWE
jgi:hypothetical protein